MKKLTILIMLSMILATAARADILDECVNGAFGGEGSNSPLCLPLMISTLPISPFISTTEGESANDRAVYVQEVRDDAADYVAAGGQHAASALLQDAMNAIRVKYPQAHALSDLQIAKVLLN